MPGYKTPIKYLRMEYANRQTLRRMRKKREEERRAKGLPPMEKSKITDNSVPWIENPKTIDDLVAIARMVEKAVADCPGKKK
ncbi:MAG: hypothetical protein AAGA58_02105 [Verrucomicrobiota bacterium]